MTYREIMIVRIHKNKFVCSIFHVSLLMQIAEKTSQNHRNWMKMPKLDECDHNWMRMYHSNGRELYIYIYIHNMSQSAI